MNTSKQRQKTFLLPIEGVLFYQDTLCLPAGFHALFPPHDLCSLRSHRFLNIVRVDIVKPEVLPTEDKQTLPGKPNLESNISSRDTYSVGFLSSVTGFFFLAGFSLSGFSFCLFFVPPGWCLSKASTFTPSSWEVSPLFVWTWLGAGLFSGNFLDSFPLNFLENTPFCCFGATGCFFSGWLLFKICHVQETEIIISSQR